MKSHFKFSTFLILAIAGAVAPSFATSKHAACDIADNQSDKPIFACTGTFAATGATDSIVFYPKDTASPSWNTMSRLNRAPLNESGSYSYNKSTPPTVQSFWPDSMLCLITGSIDTAKTVAFVVQVASTQPGNTPAYWTTLTSTNMSFTTTRTVFRVGVAFEPGMYFRTYAKTTSAGLTTATIIDHRCYVKK